MYWRLCLCVASFLVGHQVSGKDALTYRAVVVEYSPVLNSSIDGQTNIMNNVLNYVDIIQQAAYGDIMADIVVFPEVGLKGYKNQQFAMEVPDPADNVKPCATFNDYAPPLVQLSCAAAATNTYVVVNLVEKFHHDNEGYDSFYNTDVVFDSSGVVVARYRKINLYNEGNKEPSPDDQLVYFDTDFGVRFGLFTCFDIIFKTPGLDLAKQYNISHFIFPTAWFQEAPFLLAIQEQSYWSYSQNAVLLASGYNMPSFGSSGTGIYFGRQGAPVYSMKDSRGSFLLAAYVPKQLAATDGDFSVNANVTVKKLELPNSQNANDAAPEKLLLKRDHLDVYTTEPLVPTSNAEPSTNLSQNSSPITLPLIIDKVICQSSLCCEFSLNITSVYTSTSEPISRGDDYSQLYYRKMIDKEKEFDLANFLPDTLSFQANAPARYSSQVNFEDPYLQLFKKDPYEVIGERSFGKPRNIPEDVVGTPLQEFLRGAHVLITGSTGFVGKIMLEKLIRSIPHLGHVYILIRGKRGKSPKERFKELMNDRVFLRMQTEVPTYLSKITLVDGDISEEGLGLSAKDRQLLIDNVNIIFHSAANVRFIEPLRSSVSSNVIGCKRMLDLAREIKNLKVFQHVSTAYSQCVRRKIPESVPKLPIHYTEILEIIDSKSDAQLETDLHKTMHGWPNSYTFSKALCEEMLQEEGKDLPVCIVRPAVVGSTYSEPVRGWTDNLYGPAGIFVGAGLGAIHIFRLELDLCLDFVPVDYVVNCMIAAAWDTHTNWTKGSLPVYNVTSTPEKFENWKVALYCGLHYKQFWPVYKKMYHTVFVPVSNYYVDKVGHWLLHKIPGKIIDTVCVFVGVQPRLTKAYERIEALKEPLRWFGVRTWEFQKDNFKSLWRKLSEEDKKLFCFDIAILDPRLHFFLAKLGTRFYYLKEKMETLPLAERNHKWFGWAHTALKTASGYVVLKGLAWCAHYVPI